MEIITQEVRYVYVDVIGFTRGRSVEAQTEIVEILNELIKAGITSVGLSLENTILLPTGDGACIAIMDLLASYDIHLKLAINLVSQVEQYNESIDDDMRKFELRLGINENVDNVVEDINGNKNVAGAGISIARRVMDLADAQQILVGATVFETLRHREKYMRSFVGFSTQVKHGTYMNVYQYVGSDVPGLSVDTPTRFKCEAAEERGLTEYEAYYFAHSINNREYFASLHGDSISKYVGVIILWLLAEQSLNKSRATMFSVPKSQVHGGYNAPIEEIYEYYAKIDFWIAVKFKDLVSAKLRGLEEYFNRADGLVLYHAVNDDGEAKLRQEYPEIWESMVKENTA